MFEFLRRAAPSVGVVRFRGNLLPRAEEFFQQFQKAGIQVVEQRAAEGHAWTLGVSHARWGRATITAPRDQVPFPEAMAGSSGTLTKREIEEASASGVDVIVEVSAESGNVLRDRKNFLRYLYVILGDDGLVANDALAWRFWTRASLEEELMHEADLDIESLFVVHGVYDEERHARTIEAARQRGMSEEELPDPAPTWIHTHGLAELGGFDVDIVAPSPGFSSICTEFLRSIAFSIVQGAFKEGDVVPLFNEFEGWMVPVAEFHAKASAADRALRDNTEGHDRRRVVVCDPKSKGLLTFMRSSQIRPATCIRRFSEDDDGMVMPFTTEATALMAERARATAPLLRSLIDEFEPAGVPTIIKAGYPTDSDAGTLEHMWFEVKSVSASAFQAVLVVDPYDISGMSKGAEYSVPVERLTDWSMMVPPAPITPRDMRAARMYRGNPDVILKLAAIMRDQPPD